jgi:hypothetical protein
MGLTDNSLVAIARVPDQSVLTSSKNHGSGEPQPHTTLPWQILTEE